MSVTCIVYHPVFLEHDSGPGHPESSRRLTSILDSVKHSPVNEELMWIEPSPAPEAYLECIHTKDYIRRVEETCASGAPVIDSADTGICCRSFEAALYAAGGGLAAIDAVMEGRARNGFVAARPPGHHAEREAAMGFCLFNNVAIAAAYLREHYKVEKVLIVDWDVHHGNGTQHSFEADSHVFFFSTHQYPHYPGTGGEGDIGVGAGMGMTLNVPMPAGSGDEDYVKAFRDKLLPEALEFNPDFLLVSAGFDAHASDPLSEIRLTSGCFRELTHLVRHIAETCCAGRLVSFLEGGYDGKALSESVVEHLHGLSEEIAA